MKVLHLLKYSQAFSNLDYQQRKTSFRVTIMYNGYEYDHMRIIQKTSPEWKTGGIVLLVEGTAENLSP